MGVSRIRTYFANGEQREARLVRCHDDSRLGGRRQQAKPPCQLQRQHHVCPLGPWRRHLLPHRRAVCLQQLNRPSHRGRGAPRHGQHHCPRAPRQPWLSSSPWSSTPCTARLRCILTPSWRRGGGGSSATGPLASGSESPPWLSSSAPRYSTECSSSSS